MAPTLPPGIEGGPRGASDGPGVLNFAVVGDIAHAAHHVKANWPREAKDAPRLDTAAHPMVLVIELTTETVRKLQDVLARAALIEGPLARSARALKMQLATKLTGRRIPGSTERAAEGRAG